MESSTGPWVAVLAGAGVLFGLWLLTRGLAGYRSSTVVAGIGTSRIGSIPAGEVRIAGIVETAEVALVSLLQSVPCVYYRSTVGDEGDSASITEERAIGFRVRDGTGSVRVFPRGARFDAEVRFDGSTDAMGDDPAGLAPRTSGSTTAVIGDSEAARAVATESLLTIRRPKSWDLPGPGDANGPHHYREARLEPGDEVTIVGTALPFSDLSDPSDADVLTDSVGVDDPEVAADLAAARASGTLADDPEEAWGNAAIPGFGIGRPVSAPHLDSEADQPQLGSSSDAERAERTFDIAPDTLVMAASRDVLLLIAFGSPGVVVARGQRAFLTGLLGAVLAIGSAMVLAINLDGGFGL